MAETTQAHLRQRLRQQRRQLVPAAAAIAAAAVAEQLAALGLPRPGSRIAAYLTADGELDTGPVLARAVALGCEIFLPVITAFRQRRMGLARWAPGEALQGNRWGLLEPTTPATQSARWLDLVLLPCVGFDASGHRLGMGAGFYDRHLAFRRHRRAWQRPLLIGLAHAFQQVESLQSQPWDVSLDGVATDQGIHAVSPALRRYAGRSRDA